MKTCWPHWRPFWTHCYYITLPTPTSPHEILITHLQRKWWSSVLHCSACMNGASSLVVSCTAGCFSETWPTVSSLPVRLECGIDGLNEHAEALPFFSQHTERVQYPQCVMCTDLLHYMFDIDDDVIIYPLFDHCWSCKGSQEQMKVLAIVADYWKAC